MTGTERAEITAVGYGIVCRVYSNKFLKEAHDWAYGN